MAVTSVDILRVKTEYGWMFRQVGLDAERIFAHPDIKPWRTLPDRENCVLDVTDRDGSTSRFHVKRYAATRASSPAEIEQRGHHLLIEAEVPTADLVGWGRLRDGRSFTIFADLRGYAPADKLIASGFPFARLLDPTAELAAKLHMSGLHHRDLYLCHFFAKTDVANVDLKLIDVARVARLGGTLTRRRWVVKDLAQFWYSTTKLPITDTERDAWLDHYARQANGKSGDGLKRSLLRKVRAIARHDAQLKRKQPNRNISLQNEGESSSREK